MLRTYLCGLTFSLPVQKGRAWLTGLLSVSFTDVNSIEVVIFWGCGQVEPRTGVSRVQTLWTLTRVLPLLACVACWTANVTTRCVPR